MGRFENFRSGHACPLLVVVKPLKPLTVLSGAVYRLASSVGDHTPVLSNMFEEWSEKSVVLYISFVSFVINYWLLNAGFDSYSVGPSWNMLVSSTLSDYSRHFQRLYSRRFSHQKRWLYKPIATTATVVAENSRRFRRHSRCSVTSVSDNYICKVHVYYSHRFQRVKRRLYDYVVAENGDYSRQKWRQLFFGVFGDCENGDYSRQWRL